MAESSDVIIYLRGHHLLCTLCYIGKGYHQQFMLNYDTLIEHLNHGANIQLIAGPDQICQPMLNCHDCHCQRSEIRQMDEIAIAQINHQLGLALAIGQQWQPCGQRLQAMRNAFTSGCIRQACKHCQWSELCTQIANEGFQQAKWQLPY